MRGWIGALFVLCGCGDPTPPLLAVDVRTDLVPGVEVASIRVEVDGVVRGRGVDPGLDLLAGFRAAEFEELTLGEKQIVTSALDGVGRVVLTRTTAVLVNGTTGITIPLFRSCVGVVCESGTSCHGGRCVDLRCSSFDAAACGRVECSTDADCAGAACARAACVLGACLRAADDSRCATGERCDPSRGARP